VNLQRNPHLILRTESGDRYLPLVGTNCWTIGRSDDNQFVLRDRWISRNHAMMQRTEAGEFYLIDLGSRNGTFVNGRRVTIPVTLQNGDRITFGETQIDFCSATDRPTELSNDQDSQDLTAALYQRCLISVMVVDIRNFTVLTRKLDEKILSEVIGTWFRYAGDIIRQHGSWVDKYIGDAVMAVWFHRVDKVSKEEVLQICQSLVALAQITEKLNHKYPLPFPLHIGAGVNTGYAMVGNTGTGDRQDYTALGDTVNAAFRLETSMKQIGCDVAFGETTYKSVAAWEPNESVFQQHTVQLKGYEKPTITYGGSFVDLQKFVKKKSS
jgi:class 3 adenylate cyclase